METWFLVTIKEKDCYAVENSAQEKGLVSTLLAEYTDLPQRNLFAKSVTV